MEQIYDTNEKLREFDFTRLILSKPTLISGGNYFIRFKKENSPIYIQPPTCNTRNGFVKHGRKYYTDLLFTNEDEFIIQWFEKLEEHCIQYIYNHRDSWFDGNMEKADIENYFTSPLKIYKSGKFYIIRTNIPTALEKPSIKIYDEDENVVDFTTIKEDMKLMNVLEIQGIKCSARSFQIEIEMKQALVLRPEEFKLFDKCVIQTKVNVPLQEPVIDTIDVEPSSQMETPTSDVNELNPSLLVTDAMNDIVSTIEHDEILSPENDNPTNNLGKNTEKETIVHDSGITDEIEDVIEEDNIHTEIVVDDTPQINEIVPEITDNSMEEVVFTLEELPTDDKLTLREPNEVYYKMYRDARQKAKMAKELALSSYLEAKNIKNTYMLNDIDSDTSDLDMDAESIISENDSD